MQPCRKVCDRAQESCGELMERNGYQWPEGLRCETLPVERHGTLCVTPPETIDTDGRTPSSTAADVESALGPIRDMLERLQRIAQLQEENMRLQQEKLRLEIQLLQRKFPREQ
ncbi:Frizzled-1 [Amphibalanus amphitrite]|uniref:Frizzled-1 n=1 Tax=Amphibalanus amphitrite TaxID=1232801 RepID=A0A6A4WUD7_AMPAM|nr:Frizzled-1 [Amphibalanus amphitrite]